VLHANELVVSSVDSKHDRTVDWGTQ